MTKPLNHKYDYNWTVKNYLTQEVERAERSSASPSSEALCRIRVRHGIRVEEEHDEHMTALAASVKLRKVA